MTKEQAWDILYDIVLNGINCWEREEKDHIKILAYLTGVIETLGEAVK